MLVPSLKSPIGIALLAVMIVPAAGCVDYTNRFDTVNIHAGDAMAANAAIQTIDPWPPESNRTYVDANGKVVERAINGYTAPKAAAGGGTTNITINN